MTDEDLSETVDRLESQVSEQQATIERQQAEIEQLRAERASADDAPTGADTEDKRASAADDSLDPAASDASESQSDGGPKITTLATRRGILTAGGVLSMVGLGVGTASADPSGQIGTGSDELGTLFLDKLDGEITGSTELTNLAGSGLTIDGSGNLTTSGGSTSKLVTSGNTAFQVVDGGSADVSNAGSSIDAPNVVGGHPNNNTGSSSPKGAFIGGGGTQSDPNSASGTLATVGGGRGNTASSPEATVGGGSNNTASGAQPTVGGGNENTASGRYATVGGGTLNTASATSGTVPGGDQGAATNDYSFVWNDDTAYHTIPNGGDGLNSNTAVNGEPVTGSNTFSVSATSGFRFITGGASSPSVVTVDDDGSDARLQTHSYGLNIKTNDNGNLTLDPGSGNELNLDNQSTSSSGSLLARDGSGNLVEASSKTLSDVGGGGSTSKLVTSGNGDTALEVFDGGTQVKDAGSSIDPPNVIGGHPNNNTGASSPEGVTIFGGSAVVSQARNKATKKWATISGGVEHDVTGTGAVVGGGKDNEVSDNYGTISGGLDNTVSNENSVIGGGNSNTASGKTSTVSGGTSNTASGSDSSVPGGEKGAAENNHTFVWNDGTGYHSIPNSRGNGLSSSTAINSEGVTGANTFSVSATSGFRFITGSSSVTYIDSSGNLVSAGNVDLDGNAITDSSGGLTLSTATKSSDPVVQAAPTNSNVSTSDLSNSELAFALEEGRQDLRVYIKDSNGTTGNTQITGYSTARLKSNVEPFAGDPDAVFDIEPKTFTRGNGDGDDRLGLIAEEVHDAGLDYLVEYAPVEDAWQPSEGISDEYIAEYGIDRDGETVVPNDIHDRAWLAMHHELLRDHRDELDRKDDRIADLEAELDAKDARIDDQRERIDHLESKVERKDDRIEKLEAETDALQAENDDLREENDRLRERIAAIEAELGLDATADQRGVADD